MHTCLLECDKCKLFLPKATIGAQEMINTPRLEKDYRKALKKESGTLKIPSVGPTNCIEGVRLRRNCGAASVGECSR